MEKKKQVNKNKSVSILGAGLAGMAAAQRGRELGYQVEIYEKNSYVGGHASSYEKDGFIFDQGGHISFTRRPEIQDLFAKAVNNEYLSHEAVATNLWRNHWVQHPAQCHLYGLPSDVVEKCILDLAEVVDKKQPPVKNYGEWCLQNLGKTFSEEFTFRYTRKYWTTETCNMSTDFLPTPVGASRVYTPKLKEMVRGALSPKKDSVHYITHYRYPLKGGFASYLKAVSDGLDVHTNHDLVSVDLKRKELEFANGQKEYFETLISSMPLPELIPRIKNAPESVIEAAQKLVCTSLVLVNVGVKRTEGFPDGCWIYFYDEDVLFTRATVPHRFSPHVALPGCGSVQVEIYHSRYKALSCEDVHTRAIDDMIRTGLLRKEDEIVFSDVKRVQYANVLFDLNRARNLKIVQNFLEKNGVIACGRYGKWDYSWTDDSVISGWEAAERV